MALARLPLTMRYELALSDSSLFLAQAPPFHVPAMCVFYSKLTGLIAEEEVDFQGMRLVTRTSEGTLESHNGAVVERIVSR